MCPHELQLCVPEAGACDGLFVMSCPATARCRTAPHCIARGARQPGHHSHARVVPRSAASSHRVKVGSWLVIVTIRDTLNSRLLDFGIANCRICLSTGQKYQTRDPTGSKKDEGFEAKVKMKLKFFALYPLSKILQFVCQFVQTE